MMMATVEEEEEEAKAQQTQVAVDRLAPVNLVLHTPVQKRSYKEWSAWKKKVPSSLRPSLNPELMESSFSPRPSPGYSPLPTCDVGSEAELYSACEDAEQAWGWHL